LQARHAITLVAPVLVLNVPELQLVHDADPALAHAPPLQGMQEFVCEPDDSEAVPALHKLQVKNEVARNVLDQVPLLHGLHKLPSGKPVAEDQ
jgi:hypothetical protein